MSLIRRFLGRPDEDEPDDVSVGGDEEAEDVGHGVGAESGHDYGDDDGYDDAADGPAYGTKAHR